MNFNDILNKSDHFRYQLLSRMKSDCNYYLGAGGRHPKHLWAENEVDHIACMKALWNSFTENDKPEWLTMEQILEYEQKMGIKAILVEMDYKGYYERFALTPEEFEKEFPETYKHFGPIEEENSDTVKSLVHIWFEPCVVGDDCWERHFTDMACGLPESDIESGNFAYIDHNQMQSLSKYLKDQAVFHCRAVFQHDNLAFAEEEIKQQVMSAVSAMDCNVSSFKCVEEGPADGGPDFPDDKFFTFEFDIKMSRDSMISVTEDILDSVDGGELISVSYESSKDEKYYETKVLELIDNDEGKFFSPDWDGLWNSEDYNFKEILRACYNLVEKGVLKKRDCVGLAFERVPNVLSVDLQAEKPSLDEQVKDAAEQVRSVADKGVDKELGVEQDI